MVSEQVLVKNFYRALAASAYVAGSAAAGLALGGPPGAAIATANATASLASPLGVAAVELAAQQATEYTIGSKAMADGGLITQPTFALLGEAGPELVIPLVPLKKKPRSRKQKANDRRKSEAWALANAKGRRKNGGFYAGWNQRRIAEYANKVLKRS